MHSQYVTISQTVPNSSIQIAHRIIYSFTPIKSICQPQQRQKNKTVKYNGWKQKMQTLHQKYIIKKIAEANAKARLPNINTINWSNLKSFLFIDYKLVLCLSPLASPSPLFYRTGLFVLSTCTYNRTHTSTSNGRYPQRKRNEINQFL